MKAIVCEMCGSNNVLKQDGVYVCQSCNTKYSAEDAKKLMVDVSCSTIKIDETDTEANYRKLARDAKASGNSQKAAEYYNKLVELCPDDWESIFFSVYFTSANCIIAHIVSAARNVSSAIKWTYTKITDLSDAEKLEISTEMAKHVLLLHAAFVNTATQQVNAYGTLQSATNDYYDRKIAAYQMVRDMADVALLCGNKPCAIELYEIVAGYTDKKAIAKILESLEPGRGVKLMTPLLAAQQEQLEKLKKDAVVGPTIFGILLLGCLIWLLCASEAFLPLIGLAIIGVAMFFGFMASSKSIRSVKERIETLEEEIAHLKD